jgi:hypothetical protein
MDIGRERVWGKKGSCSRIEGGWAQMESITTHLTSWSWGWELDLSKDGPAMHVLLVWDGAGGKRTHNCYLQSTVFFPYRR